MQTNEITGIIISTLPNFTFKIKLDDNTLIVANTSAKLRLSKTKLLVGDRVLVQYSNLKVGRIICKYKL
ncbi:MAG: translation initiation factor IF-1 [Candidatus Hodgkinia cicadicola]